MTLSALGIFSAAGAGGADLPSDFELIETSIVSGSSTTSITFSNLGNFSSTYRHLQIRSACMVNTSATLPRIRFNGDTGSNYSSHFLGGTGGVVETGAEVSGSSMYWGFFATSSSSNFALAVITDILDPYSTTKNKTIRSLWGQSYIQLQSGNWRSTSAVSSITISSPVNFVAGSRFSLYGIKG